MFLKLHQHPCLLIQNKEHKHMSTITCTDILHTNAQSNQNKQKTN